MILWPAIIHHPGQTELSYIDNQAQWQREAQSQAYQSADRLIDSSGNSYALVGKPDHIVPPEPVGTVPLDEIINLIRAHAAQAGHCCVAKLFASSIPEAIRLVGTLEG